jgi:single-stranded-DNA-specific exonuclease
MKWVLAECDENAAAALAQGAGLHPLIARLMVNRGIIDSKAARAFLDCELSRLSSPTAFSGMERAVERIRKAITLHEKIVVYGDYDVDGVSAAALLYLVLKNLNADVDCYIPDRISEGYGLNTGALHRIRSSGAGLVITVDCGIGAFREAEAAGSLGLDLIITDHHEIAVPEAEIAKEPGMAASLHSTAQFKLPEAYALLHPWLVSHDTDEVAREQLGSLTGVGVAFKLAQALLGLDSADEDLLEWLDLVALGTVADVGKIQGENRVLVRHGLDRLSGNGKNERPGIAALKHVAGLSNGPVTAGTVGFTLAPRINASGRLERADMAFRLLTTESREEADRLASALDDVNRQRQAVEASIQEEARRLCLQEALAATGAFVLSSREWHPGVVGIVAARLVEEFYRPTALICVKEGIGKGSARSIAGFDLYKGLHMCSDLLLGFGGHTYAAGFTITEDRIAEFRERLGSLVMKTMGTGGFTRTQVVDGPVRFDELTVELVRELEKLAPFGQGNPEPRLGARGLEVISSRVVGNNHLKLRLRQHDAAALDAIAFNRANTLGKAVRDGARVAAVFTPRVNAWNGATAVELEIRDLKIDNEIPKIKEHTAHK